MGVEKCQGCAYLNPIMFHCGKYLRGIETAVYLCDTAKPQTNADRIRAMGDTELAEWIANEIWKAFAQGAGNPFFNQEEAVKLENQEWLDWLKQEVKE